MRFAKFHGLVLVWPPPRAGALLRSPDESWTTWRPNGNLFPPANKFVLAVGALARTNLRVRMHAVCRSCKLLLLRVASQGGGRRGATNQTRFLANTGPATKSPPPSYAPQRVATAASLKATHGP